MFEGYTGSTELGDSFSYAKLADAAVDRTCPLEEEKTIKYIYSKKSFNICTE